MRGTTYATRIGSRSVCKDFRDAVVAALYARPLGTHELALAIGRGDYGNLHDRFSDPASHHCMATFFAELKAMAQGVSGGNEQTVEKD